MQTDKGYSDKERGFSLSYSEDWDQKIVNNQCLFLLKEGAKNTGFRNNTNILVQDLTNKPMSLQEYQKLTFSQIIEALGRNTVSSVDINLKLGFYNNN